MSPITWHGIIPPVCTPFTSDGAIDRASLEQLTRFLLDAGVHGLFMLGSTSEAATLTTAQRAEILEIAVGTVAGQVPVLAGVIDMGTAQMIAHGRIAKRIGVDALVSTAPFYIRPGTEEIITHFIMLREEVDLPVFAYEIPQNVQTVIGPDTMIRLAEEGLISGCKDSSGNEGGFRRVVLGGRNIDGFAAFTGSELTADAAMWMGASGIVPGLGNVDPAGYVALYDAAVCGDWDTARREQERLVHLFDITTVGHGRIGHTASALGGFKTALQVRGIIASNTMGRPMPSLNADKTAGVRAILETAGVHHVD